MEHYRDFNHQGLIRWLTQQDNYRQHNKNLNFLMQHWKSLYRLRFFQLDIDHFLTHMILNNYFSVCLITSLHLVPAWQLITSIILCNFHNTTFVFWIALSHRTQNMDLNEVKVNYSLKNIPIPGKHAKQNRGILM